MQDDPLKGCLLAVLGLAAMFAFVVWSVGDRKPQGPSCYDVLQKARTTEAEDRFLDRCMRGIEEDRRNQGR